MTQYDREILAGAVEKLCSELKVYINGIRATELDELALIRAIREGKEDVTKIKITLSKECYINTL